mgnify:CR=1 FL=1
MIHKSISFKLATLAGPALLLAACGGGSVPTLTPSPTATEAPTATPEPSVLPPSPPDDPDNGSDSDADDDDGAGASPIVGASSGLWLYIPQPHTITCPGSSNSYAAGPNEEVEVTFSNGNQKLTFSNSEGSITLAWNAGADQYEGSVTRSAEGQTVEVMYTLADDPDQIDTTLAGTITWSHAGCSFHRAFTLSPLDE